MCKILNEQTLEGNSKKAQIAEWKQYFEFEKVGTKYLITEIYDIPKEKNDLRKEGNNSIYVKYVELLLMYFLSNKEGYTFTLRKNEWFQVLGVVNNNYVDHFYRPKCYQFSDSEVSTFDLNDFYRRVPPKLEKIMFSALRNMKNRCLLDYFEETMIVETINEKQEHRKATNEEIRQLVSCKNEVLKNMGFVNMTQVFLKFKNKEFYDALNAMLYKRYGWNYSYRQYCIIYSHKCIQQDIPLTEINIQRLELNQKIVSAVNTQAEEKYNKAQADYNELASEVSENWNGFGKPNKLEKKHAFQYQDTYLNAQRKLANYFLKI